MSARELASLAGNSIGVAEAMSRQESAGSGDDAANLEQPQISRLDPARPTPYVCNANLSLACLLRRAQGLGREQRAGNRRRISSVVSRRSPMRRAKRIAGSGRLVGAASAKRSIVKRTISLLPEQLGRLLVAGCITGCISSISQPMSWLLIKARILAGKSTERD